VRLLITADTVGGVWTYTRELVTQLTRRGHEVVLVSFGSLPTRSQTEWLKDLRGVDFRPTEYKLEWMQHSAQDLQRSSEFLLRVIAETKPELLHSSQYCYGALACDIPKVVVAHSDVVSWWHAVHGTEPEPSDWMGQYKEVVARGVCGADAVVGVTCWMLQQIQQHYARPQIGTVIYNGRTPSLFSSRGRKEELALSVGRLWDEAKQTSLLSEIKSPMPVWIAGAEQHPENARTFDKRGGSLACIGPQSEVQLSALYARAGVYVATSRYEPFGLAPLEAALSGCAIVANDIETLREVWGDAALYFRRNDAGDLQRQLEELNQNPSLRAHYARHAYERAQQKYSAERMAGEYLEVYGMLTSRKAIA
jgi:glycogen(starch) synthase